MVAIETLSIMLKTSAKRSLLLLLWAVLGLLPCSSLYGQEADSTLYRLRVIVDGISKKEGNLIVGVVNRRQWEERSLKECRQIVPITDQTMEVKFDSLRAGDYAIMVIVKEDVNSQNVTPMEEQTGFSQNPKKPWKGVIHEDGTVSMSAPEFEQIMFQIPQKKTMRIVLGNPAKSVELKEQTK